METDIGLQEEVGGKMVVQLLVGNSRSAMVVRGRAELVMLMLPKCAQNAACAQHRLSSGNNASNPQHTSKIDTHHSF
jgi:hypothetical protein